MQKKVHRITWVPVWALLLLAVSGSASAGPAIAPDDMSVRHDVQRLADFGIVSGPTSTWPLAWGPILADISLVENIDELPRDVQDAIYRLKARGSWETATDDVQFRTRLSLAEDPAAFRSFQGTPRESAELSAGISWIGERLSFDLNATIVDDAADGNDIRADGSQVSLALGNMTIAASTLDRWWGPGWDSSLILSTNARPIPAITLDRRFTSAPKSKWLSWIGPWDFSLVWGELENDRAVPNARFFGARFNFRPVDSLEIGISRTAQWCGEGRPCDFDTFWNLLIGTDNRGDGVSLDDEPGNQLAGLDFRWNLMRWKLPVAVYGQFIGEDEAGGFPSRYIAQVGVEGSAYLFDDWSMRWFAEATSTTCDFWKSEEIFNCAYNHFIYETGYRYQGRSIGHTVDNDARVATLGVSLVDLDNSSWQGLVRAGRLNRGGAEDPANTVSALPQDLATISLIHHRSLARGRLEIGIGYERIDGNPSIPSRNGTTAFIQWRSHY